LLFSHPFRLLAPWTDRILSTTTSITVCSSSAKAFPAYENLLSSEDKIEIHGAYASKMRYQSLL
jgi:hypothetical protein